MADSILPLPAPAPAIRAGNANSAPPLQPAPIYLDALAVAAVISDPTRFRILQIMAPSVAFAAVHLEYILRSGPMVPPPYPLTRSSLFTKFEPRHLRET